MAGAEKRPSGLQRSVAASRPDSDQTDPNARVEGLGHGDDDERTSAGDELLVTPSGDKTQVYDPTAAKRAGGSEYKLLVLAGPKAGSEFVLAETVMTLGRAPDNHVAIPDVSVSRKHVRFTRLGDDGFTVEDLGSGNGTKVNGDVIQGPVHLRHGDEVAMGDTTVQLVESGVPVVKKKGAVKPPIEAAATRLVPPDEAKAVMAAVQAQIAKSSGKPAAKAAAAAAPAADGGLSPAKKKLYVGIFAAILVLLVVASLVKGGGEPPAEEPEVDVAAGLDEANKLAGAGKWGEAESRLKVLLEESGGDPDVKTRYEKVRANAQAQKQVSQAKKALQADDFAAAREKLAAVSQKSVFYEDAHKLGEEVDAAVARAASEARGALASGDKDRASVLADRVLAADAQNAAALAVRQELDKKNKRAVAPAGDAPAAGGGRRRAAEAERPKDEADEAPRGSSAITLYMQGDLQGALRAAEQSGDPLLRQMRLFDASFRDGAAKAQGNRAAEAVKSLATAFKTDREIARGKPSKLGAEVGKALGNQEYLLGLDSKGDEQLARAAAHFAAAVEADPTAELYRKALEKAQAKALEIYTQAYVMKATAPDEARRLFRIACEALPASHEKHERACNFYTQLGGK